MTGNPFDENYTVLHSKHEQASEASRAKRSDLLEHGETERQRPHAKKANRCDYTFMQAALKEAGNAAAREEVPIGALLVNEKGEIIAQNSNRTRELNDPTAHAEILCIREACTAANAQRITGSTLYVTLEPCTMCAAAISFARIKRVVIGAPDPKGGGILHGAKFYEQPTCHHRPTIETGLLTEECGKILKDFFKERR